MGASRKVLISLFRIVLSLTLGFPSLSVTMVHMAVAVSHLSCKLTILMNLSSCGVVALGRPDPGSCFLSTWPSCFHRLTQNSIVFGSRSSLLPISAYPKLHSKKQAIINPFSKSETCRNPFFLLGFVSSSELRSNSSFSSLAATPGDFVSTSPVSNSLFAHRATAFFE